MISGIILAAGASQRMGSPKALLDYRGETFLERLTRILAPLGDLPIVVVGYHATEIKSQAAGRARFVVNPDPSRGQLSSLQTGLAALPAKAEGFAFMPIDCPAVREDTVALLAHAFANRHAATLFVIPRYGNQRGHPVFATRQIADELLMLPLSGQARDVVHSHVDRTEYVDVDDPGILVDVDDPTAYSQLVSQSEAQ